MLPKLVLPARPDFLIVDHNLGILNQQCETIAGVFKVFKTPPFLLFLCSPCWVSFELGWESLLSHLDLSGRALPLSASNLASSDLLDHNGRVVLLVSTPGAHLPTSLVHLIQNIIKHHLFLVLDKRAFPCWQLLLKPIQKFFSRFFTFKLLGLTKIPLLGGQVK